MKNIIKYYYNLDIDSIRQVDNDYYIIIDKKMYILSKCDNFNIRNISNIVKNNRIFHTIINTVNGTPIIKIHGNEYILLKINCVSKKIEVKDINTFLYLFNTKKDQYDNEKWPLLWERLIDYIEYQASQNKTKYREITRSLFYYIGLTENAIQFIRYNNVKSVPLYITHNRIKYNDNLINLYNPLSLTIDTRVRDMAEYLKNYFFFSDDNSDFYKLCTNYVDTLMPNEIILFMARMMYPSYYFDLYDEIILGNINQDQILNITKKGPFYESFLKRLYAYIKGKVYITSIEWFEH